MINETFVTSTQLAIPAWWQKWTQMQFDTHPSRRRHPRYDVRCRARIRIGTRYYAGFIDNISVSGAKLRTISPIGRLGHVVLRLPDLPALRCTLCWTDAHNAGVSFSMGLSRQELDTWARSRSGPLADQVARDQYADMEEPVS